MKFNFVKVVYMLFQQVCYNQTDCFVFFLYIYIYQIKTNLDKIKLNGHTP